MNTNKKIKILLWAIIISFLFSLVLIQNLSKKVNPIVLRYSTIEAKRFGNFMVNYSLDKQFLNSLDEDIFVTKKNSKGEIQLIDFKAKKVNTLLENVTQKIQSNLIKLENGKIDKIKLADTFYGLRFKNIKKGVVCEIPAGVLFSNSLLSNNGPVLPLKFNFIGQVVSNLNTKMETYGINSVYMEVYIHIEVNEQITMPLTTKSVLVEVDIPLAIKVIQGNIPNYYQNQITKDSSSFSLPVE